VSRTRLAPGDVALGVALAAVCAAVTCHGADVIGTKIADWQSFDLWFQSDAPRLFENLTRRHSDHYRSNVHPLFSLVGYGGVYLLRRFFRLDSWTAVHAFEALVAAGWAATLYLLLRLAGHRRLDGTVLTLLGVGSAAAVLWLSMPESYGLGSLTLMLPLVVLAAVAIRPLPIGWWALASAASLSITVTNWMSGLAATLRALGWRRAALASAAAVVVVTTAWGVEHRFFPSTEFFVSHEEQDYLRVPTPARIARVIGVMAIHTMVVPRIGLAFDDPHWLSVQRSWPGSGGPLGVVATIAWVVLFGLGLREAGRRWRTDPLVLVTLACLAGQLALHIVYGEETLLYAMHWLPLLILVAGFALLGPQRPWALALASVTLVSGSAHNLPRLDSIARMFRTPRQDVQDQMARRPGDPWPRSEAHVILATPGTAADAKAYLEPGGSFSPRAGSFGIALWVRDSSGRLRTTSDAIALDQLRQRFDTGSSLPPPALIESPWYTARWSYDGLWHLRIRPAKGARVEVVLRSVGPAGGPVRRLQWSEGLLRVNDAWSLRPDFAPAAMILGDERDRDWVDAAAHEQAWDNQEGWGYARLPLPGDTSSSLTISEGAGKLPSTYRLQPLPELRVPDPDFETSLHAQVAHLLMGTVGDETRSADPLNTATPWQRTGAYEIVALLRAGQIDRARALSELMMRQDYYGGFGAEADAPGLGIWALAEVAAALGDSAYDHRAWTAIDRKAGEIERLLEARDTIRAKVPNSIVPAYRSRHDIDVVAAPAREGLVVGRMDHQYPLLYVNAVSYLGLREAASLAQRVGERHRSEALRRRAGALRQAWLGAYRGEERVNVRTLATALWPTGVIDTGDGRARLRAVLAENRASRWDASGRPREWPLWTYFDVAEAHQWLGLARPETAWTTLRWFWRHQTSPGLYTWWEDKEEGNSYRLWDKVRGWVHPRMVTPHYWTSAQVLLLQLDMLVMPVPGRQGPALILGAGVPPCWLTDSLGVRGLRVLGRTVDWTWDRRRVRAVVRGAPIELRLGPAFPRGTRLVLGSGAL
jgi:hypothetical protein